MQKLSPLGIVLTITISVLLVSLGDRFVLQRKLIGTTESMTIRGDTDAYVSMIEGDWVTTQSPFKFRILVPFLAGLLPFSPTDSLKFISYLSLLLSYVFILLTCMRLGLNTTSSVIGLLSVWASTWHLYNYHNPFLTDSFGLCMLCIMTFALLNDSYVLFLTAGLLGILARETTVFLVPVWLVKREWRRGILLTAVCVVALLVPRYFLASETDTTFVSALHRVGALRHPLTFARSIFWSWGFVWFVSVIGIWYLPSDRFALAVAVYGSLLCGGILTSLIAIDTGRVLSVLTPVLAIANAHFYAELAKRRKHLLAFVFVGLVVLQAFVSLENIVFGIGSRVFGLPRTILLGAEVIYLVFVAAALGTSLPREMRTKTMHLLQTTR